MDGSEKRQTIEMGERGSKKNIKMEIDVEAKI